MSLINKQEYAVAVIGQPNCGKTTLFNALTGSNQYVGNWPGVTVEKKTGKFELNGNSILLQDLPGTYSLIPWSADEKVSRDYLFSEQYDAIINIIEAHHLERQLYLTFQLASIGVPMLVVVNMMDEFEAEGKLLDVKRLSALLGMPVVAMSLRLGKGLDEFKSVLAEMLSAPKLNVNQYAGKKAFAQLALSPETELLAAIESVMQENTMYQKQVENDYPNIKPFAGALLYLLGDTGMRCYTEQHGPEMGRLEMALLNAKLNFCYKKHAPQTINIDEYIAKEFGIWLYGIARGIARECIKLRKDNEYARKNYSALIDRVVLQLAIGFPVFLLVIFLLFQLTFSLGDIVINYLEIGLDYLNNIASNLHPAWLSSLIQHGVIGGAGNVLLLTPYIFIMFFLLSFLEDSGYMARIAFVTDHIMHKLGLHGRAFIPLIMGFGCNVPALMAVRTLDNEKDKIKASLMIPFISCSARLPVYVLFAGAFFKNYAGIVVFSLYFAGIAAGIFTGWFLSKTIIQEKSEGVIMELPPYRLPLIKNMVLSAWTKTKSYIVKAGTVILGLSIVLWMLSSYPEQGAGSFLAGIGRAIAWLFKPLGFDWIMTVGLLSGFVAKEVVISTLGILYADSGDLSTLLPAVINIPTALAYLVFIVLYTPCVATLAVLKAETGKIRWAIFSVSWGLFLAWISAFIVKQVAQVVMYVIH